jgi:hypothetical protein
MKKNIITILFLTMFYNPIFGQGSPSYEETMQWIKGTIETYGTAQEVDTKYLLFDDCTINHIYIYRNKAFSDKIRLQTIENVISSTDGQSVIISCLYGQKLILRNTDRDDYISVTVIPIKKNNENIAERLAKALNYARKMCGAKDPSSKF